MVWTFRKLLATDDVKSASATRGLRRRQTKATPQTVVVQRHKGTRRVGFHPGAGSRQSTSAALHVVPPSVTSYCLLDSFLRQTIVSLFEAKSGANSPSRNGPG